MIASKRNLFYSFLVLYFLSLIVVAVTTPITPSEARLFFQPIDSIVAFLMHLGHSMYSTEFGLRMFFLMLGFINALLYYQVTSFFFSKSEDRYLTLAIYLLLPGMIAASVLANSAIVVSTLVLLFVYGFLRKYWVLASSALLLLSFVHWSALVFFSILILYSLFIKSRQLFYMSALALCLYFFVGIDIPDMQSKSHFVELLGTYATIFSPLLFIYIFYALYRVLLRGTRDIVWCISFFILILSLVLSFWQKISIVDFSPYIMIGVVIAINVYYASLRVRLRRFQAGYRLMFWIVTVSLILSSFSIIFHQPIYRFVGKVNYSIVAPIYEPYDASKKLKQENKICEDIISKRAIHQMRYYGVKKCF